MAHTMMKDCSTDEIKGDGRELGLHNTVPTTVRVNTVAVCAAFLEAQYQGLYCLVLGADQDKWGSLVRHPIQQGTRHLAVFGRINRGSWIAPGSTRSTASSSRLTPRRETREAAALYPLRVSLALPSTLAWPWHRTSMQTQSPAAARWER